MDKPESKFRYVRLGSVLKNKDGEGSYIALGNTKAKEDKYNFSVELTVKDAAGNVVATQKNGYVSVFDPRTSRENVPEHVLFELSLRMPK